jgi:hypothetical protein
VEGRVFIIPSFLSDLVALGSKHPVGSFTASSVVSFLIGKKIGFVPALKRWARCSIDEYYDTKAYLAERKAACEKRIATARSDLTREKQLVP